MNVRKTLFDDKKHNQDAKDDTSREAQLAQVLESAETGWIEIASLRQFAETRQKNRQAAIKPRIVPHLRGRPVCQVV